MESVRELKIAEMQAVERKIALEHWLNAECGMEPALLQPMQGDASTRSYFRICSKGQSFVVMDAPPPENVHAFCSISKALKQLGLNTPEIYQANLTQGFLLITDFGDATFLKTLNKNNADKLYQLAFAALSVLQTCKSVEDHNMPIFNSEFMFKEWDWHKEWFLKKWLRLSFATENSTEDLVEDLRENSAEEIELDNCYAHIVKIISQQPRVFMHRDYHSANLMLLPNNNVGILDFQDAFFGPVTYDVVSLLRDCYIAWPEERVKKWAISYLNKLKTIGALSQVSEEEFLFWFDYMGMQRQLKALLTFSRKQVRDYQPQYLKYIPLTLNYLLTVSRKYSELNFLHHYLQNIVLPASQQVKV